MTVHREARTYTGNRLSPVLLHVMASEQELRRPLLTPDEVMRLPDDTALIFVAGRAPIYGRRIRYYEDPVFADRASVPPPVGSDRLAHDGRNDVGSTLSSPAPSEEDEWLSLSLEPRPDVNDGGSEPCRTP